ncbi:RidA family protein [Roseobacter denitrificans]|uniref:Endoribonuclease L-PSP family protein, putative n=1 Tax=Roseobacter denitrificans (strain ATCC 33942 / OCh 114) TaxID=375451 RepID=Q165G1_ROSDO|nr:RidA family protein [Roseobacter denitrificans]ABG32382.1 endoribonuclease L-PSP family protein, putative [Roseobacter denitrificans OCh 114]AVL51854.1 RidA family protein [Roseobacter denitrificans]SFF81097.1 Enamine deaminase RidA, house cleaning of reactive enamine intermediates, YjgF/YER057c/UK114 family [Roseobacter denitrificans OCh 114]
MSFKRISSGGAFETKVGYCRAVVAGGWVHVSGTVGQGDTVTEQCASALSVIEGALEKAGCGFADVVRVTYMLPRAADFESCWPLLRAAFGANPPAATMIECNLIDPHFRIEIEVTALLPE